MSGRDESLDPKTVTLADFPVRSHDKLRYADTDRQGHINNAVFSTFLETGRVEILYNPDEPLADQGAAFVIARLELDLHGEINWPGQVDIGTRVGRVGRSSVTLQQAVFQQDRCVATAQTVIVQMNESSRRAQPLSAAAVEKLEALSA